MQQQVIGTISLDSARRIEVCVGPDQRKTRQKPDAGEQAGCDDGLNHSNGGQHGEQGTELKWAGHILTGGKGEREGRVTDDSWI